MSKSTVWLSVCDFFCVEMIDAAIAEGVPVYIHESVSFPAGIYNVVDDEPVPFAEYLADLAQAIGVPKPFRLPTILGKWMFAPSRRF